MARGGQSTHGGASSSGRHHSHNPLLLAVNESTKWLVSGAAGLFLLLRHDAPVMWCLLGALFSSFLNKALKHVINESRPANARKADPGMPSSHANSLAFLGAYSAATLLTSSSPDQSLATSSYLGAAALAAGSAFLAWLRIALGYHTAPQVLVGFLLGASTALAWLALGTRYALPALARHPYYQAWLTGATYVAVAMFIARNLLSWVQGLRYMRTAGPVPAVQKQ